MTSKKILQYSEASMQDALSAARNGMPIKTASKIFRVPRTTLLYKFKGINPEFRKMGPATIFSNEEENLLVHWVLQMAKSGFPISKNNFLASVSKLALELNKKFKNDIPGRKWYESFLRRHAEISLRTPQNLTMSRSSVTKNKIQNWFLEVTRYLEESNNMHILQDPSRIFNADESAFFLNPKGSKVLAHRGEKTVYATVNSNEKECLTVLINGNAAGTLAPPMIIFRYKRIPSELSTSVPKHWGVGISESGWMTSDTFYSYIANVFYPWAKENVTFPIIFFVDGHVSHLSFHLSRFCSEKGIILVALYPNATHLLQPMDVAVFRSLKSGWKEQVNSWRSENQHKTLRKRDFAQLLEIAIKDRVTPTVLQNGFRKCGIYPWNSQMVADLFPDNDEENREVFRKPNHENKSFSNEDKLTFFESFINQDTLQQFRQQFLDDQWIGETSDKSLFYVWKNIKNTLHLRDDSPENLIDDLTTENVENMINEAVIVFEDESIGLEKFMDHPQDLSNTSGYVFDNFQDPLDLSENLVDDTCGHVVEKSTDNPLGLPENLGGDTGVDANKIQILDIKIIHPKSSIQSSQSGNVTKQAERSTRESEPMQNLGMEITDYEITHKTPNKSTDKNTPAKLDQNSNVPSPFKRVLFWPEEKAINSNNKRKREKIPSVITSELWQEYSRKKMEKKKKIEEEKLDKKRKLEVKKLEKSKKPSKKRTPVLMDTSSEDNSSNSEKEEDENEQKSKLKPRVGDHVIVLYDRKYFPGQIMSIKNNEYFVNAMSSCGKTGWRWPALKDQIWYSKKDVVEVTEPPKAINSRGIFNVKEMRKYPD